MAVVGTFTIPESELGAKIVRPSCRDACRLSDSVQYLEQQLVHPEFRKCVRLIMESADQTALDAVLYNLSAHNIDPSEEELLRELAAGVEFPA